MKNVNPQKRKKLKKVYKITIIILIAILVLIRFEKYSSPLYKQVCEDRTKSIATIVSNEQATNVMTNYSYDDMFTIEKDTDGNITMIKSNITNINAITSDIAVKIQYELENSERNQVAIPLGAFTGIRFLSGSGPDVKIKIVVLGSIETELKSEFLSQGINQTLHRVYLDVKCPISILTPYRDINETISNQVLLIENVIVGQIPNAFYNLQVTK